jgi:hypothetical protein
LFADGETPVATGRARLGRVSVARNAAVAIASVALSGGAAGMFAVSKAYFVLLTSERLLLLEPHWLTGRPTAKIVGNLPRSALTITNVKRSVMTSVTIAVSGSGNGLLLKYPTFDKEGAEALVEAFAAAGN